MPALVRMPGGMTVGRAVTAECRAAGLAGTQVNPAIAALDALLALQALRLFHGLDRLDMHTSRFRCHGPSFTREVPGERRRSRSDGGRHALDAARPHVTDGEHPGQARLQQVGPPAEWPVRRTQFLRGQLGTRLSETSD